MQSTEASSGAWLDTEALVAILGLAISLAVTASGVAAITHARVTDDTRPARDAPSTLDDDATARSYVMGA